MSIKDEILNLVSNDDVDNILESSRANTAELNKIVEAVSNLRAKQLWTLVEPAIEDIDKIETLLADYGVENPQKFVNIVDDIFARTEVNLKLSTNFTDKDLATVKSKIKKLKLKKLTVGINKDSVEIKNK